MIVGRRCAGARLGALAIVVALAGLVGLVGFGRTAHAATAYRYWTYYIAGADAPGSWVYSQRGPGSEHPQDGEVQGWRFAVQADRSGGLSPRIPPAFAKLCAGDVAQAGKVRVGIVLDFGVADDAPAGERPPAGVVTGCVQVPDGGSGVDVLDAAVGSANVRIGNGLICGIDGYPKSECAAVVAAPKPPAQSAEPAATQPEKAAAPSTKQPAEASRTPQPAPTTTDSRSPAAESAQAAATPAPSSAAAATPASANPSVAALSALKGSSRDGFPSGVVIGGALVVALGIAAVVRAVAARR